MSKPDYVDDSEPERKRIRTEARKRRTCKKQSPPFNHPPPPGPPWGDTSVAISEGLDGVLTEVTPAFVENAVEEIIGEELQSVLKTSESSIRTLPSSHHATPASAQQLVSRVSATGAQEESLEPSLMACVERFAYRNVRAETEPATSHTERCQPASVPQVRSDKDERLCRRAKSLPEHDITKLDVSPLLRCVSCEARWTIRKGAANKLSHLVTCARKKGISPGTLKTLVVKENLKIQHVKTKDETRTPSIPAPAAPQTYMEAVVSNAQPKKRQRRPDATGTLRPIGQTKAAILDRAKALLGTRDIAPRDTPEPEPTQAFGQSKLASGHTRMVDIDPIVTHLSEESALSSRLDFLRSMAGSPHS